MDLLSKEIRDLLVGDLELRLAQGVPNFGHRTGAPEFQQITECHLSTIEPVTDTRTRCHAPQDDQPLGRSRPWRAISGPTCPKGVPGCVALGRLSPKVGVTGGVNLRTRSRCGSTSGTSPHGEFGDTRPGRRVRPGRATPLGALRGAVGCGAPGVRAHPHRVVGRSATRPPHGLRRWLQP